MTNFNELHKIENDIVIDFKAFYKWVDDHLSGNPEARKHLADIIEATAQVKKLNAEAAIRMAEQNMTINQIHSQQMQMEAISTQPISGIEDTHSDASASVDTVGGAV